MNVPGFNGKLVGRRNFLPVVGGGFNIASSSFSLLVLASMGGKTNVGIEGDMDTGVDGIDALTSMCSGDVMARLNGSCLARITASGFGIRFSKLK